MSPATAPTGPMLQAVAQDALRPVLSSWVATARQAYLSAGLLLSVDDASMQRVRESAAGPLWLDLLIPAYWQLLRRYAVEVEDGKQPDMFEGDFETQLATRWTRFAVDYLADPEQARSQRLVLQCTVGLEGELDKARAANALVDLVQDGPLPYRLRRERP